MSNDWARPVVHWELEAVDAAAQAAFYRAMFNWDMTDNGFMVSADAGFGGPEPGPAGHIRATGASRFTLYVQVRDLRESLDRAVELGGTITMEPLDLPNAPTLAGITDPEGNPVTLVQA